MTLKEREENQKMTSYSHDETLDVVKIPVESLQVEYNFIKPEDYHLLEPIFAAFNASVPSPTISRIATASFNNEIIGFYCLQLLPHAEPMWIKPEWKGSKIWIRLAAMVDTARQNKKTFIVAENEESKRMCMAMGLKRVEFPVFVKE